MPSRRARTLQVVVRDRQEHIAGNVSPRPSIPRGLLPWRQSTCKTANRPQFHAMFDAAYQRQFDVVLFWSLDRFSREGVLETLQHLQKLTSFGVAFKSHSEIYLDGTGVFRDAVISILAAIAKQERVRISERTIAGIERARAKGRVGGRPRVNREQDKHADKIRQMREDGESYQQIADQLGRSRSDIQRVCMTLGCAAAPAESMMM